MPGAKGLSSDRAAEVDRVVFGIVDQMRDGTWSPRCYPEIAQRENVAISRVKDWATEAGRIFRWALHEDRDALRAVASSRLDQVYADATEDREHGARVAAVATQAKLLGLNAPEKHVVAHVEVPLTLEEVEQAIEAFQAERLRLLAERPRTAPQLVEATYPATDGPERS